MMSDPKSSGQQPKKCGQETFVESKVYSDHHKNGRKRATAKINSLLLIYNSTGLTHLENFKNQPTE